MNFKVLKASDNFGELTEKIEYNFNQIMLFGGGPKGDKGDKGEDGGYGLTGKKGDKGDKGPAGSHIWFETSIIPDGTIVTNPAYSEGDAVVTSNGNYYSIETSGSNLIYHFEFNLLPLSGQYLISQIDYDSAGNPVDTWQQLDAPTSKEANLLLVKKTTGSGNDKSNFYRLFLGLDSNPTILNCAQLIANILPFETSGVMTVATDAPFAQFGLKYRPNSRSNPTTNTVFFKYYEPVTDWIFEIDNAGTKLQLINDTADPANSSTVLLGFKQLFKTPNSIFSTITVLHDAFTSTFQSRFDIAVGSINPTTGKVLINNKTIRLSYAGDTDMTAAVDTYNLNLIVNTHFKRKIKKDFTVMTLSSSTLNILSAGAKPIIYLDGGTGLPVGTDILDTIIGGEDNEVLTLTALSRPIRIVAKESPVAGQIKFAITTNIKKSEIELSPRETITLYKKTGQTFWNVIGFNRHHALEATDIITHKDLTYSDDPMEAFIKFNPGFYNLTGINLPKISDPNVKLLPADIGSNISLHHTCALQIINIEHDPASLTYHRLYMLHGQKAVGGVSYDVWVRRSYSVGGINQFSDWVRLANSADLTALETTLLTYIDTQITNLYAKIYYKLVPNFVYMPYNVTTFTNFDATGLGISGDVVNWAICNGKNGTPDLRGYFLVGATAIPNQGAASVPGALGSYALGATGGARDVALTVPNLPPHVHNIQTNGNNDNGGSGRASVGDGAQEGILTTDSTGPAGNPLGQMAATPHNNLPPYKATVWIMKMPTTIPLPPQVCSVPTQFQFTALSGTGVYSFKFKSANSTFASVDLRWSYNGGTQTVVNIPFSSITDIGGGYYTFNFQPPGFANGEYSFAMRINCAATDHSSYTATIVNNATGTAQHLIKFSINLSSPSEAANKTITSISVTDTLSATTTQLLVPTDPGITAATGPAFYMVPVGIYDINLTITGTPAFTLTLELTNPAHSSENQQLAYAAPGTFQFLAKTVSDDALSVNLNDF